MQTVNLLMIRTFKRTISILDQYNASLLNKNTNLTICFMCLTLVNLLTNLLN